MQARLDAARVAPELTKAAIALEGAIRNSGLELPLLHLVKMRASQINGCAFCLHMHSRDARAHGESEERLYLLNAWRESPLFTARERAALAWTEALTLIAETHAPDEVYEEVRRHFSEEETAKLTLAIEDPAVDPEAVPRLELQVVCADGTVASGTGEHRLPRGHALVTCGGDFSGWREEVREVELGDSPQSLVFRTRREPRIAITLPPMRGGRLDVQAGDDSITLEDVRPGVLEGRCAGHRRIARQDLSHEAYEARGRELCITESDHRFARPADGGRVRVAEGRVARGVPQRAAGLGHGAAGRGAHL